MEVAQKFMDTPRDSIYKMFIFQNSDLFRIHSFLEHMHFYEGIIPNNISKITKEVQAGKCVDTPGDRITSANIVGFQIIIFQLRLHTL